MYYSHARTSVGTSEPSLEGSVVPNQAVESAPVAAPVGESANAGGEKAPESAPQPSSK